MHISDPQLQKMLNQQSKKAIYLRWSAVILLLLVAFGTWFSFDKYKSTQIKA